MQTIQGWEVDLIEFENRKYGNGGRWLEALNSQLLQTFLTPAPAASITRDAPAFQQYSALSSGHSSPSQTPLLRGSPPQSQNSSLRLLSGSTQAPCSGTDDGRPLSSVPRQCVLWTPEVSCLHQRLYSDCYVTDRQQMLLFLHVLRTICPPSEVREETGGPGGLF